MPPPPPPPPLPGFSSVPGGFGDDENAGYGAMPPPPPAPPMDFLLGGPSGMFGAVDQEEADGGLFADLGVMSKPAPKP